MQVCLCQDVAFIYHPETKALRPWKQTKFGPGGRSINVQSESSWIKDGQTHVKASLAKNTVFVLNAIPFFWGLNLPQFFFNITQNSGWKKNQRTQRSVLEIRLEEFDRFWFCGLRSSGGCTVGEPKLEAGYTPVKVMYAPFSIGHTYCKRWGPT